LLVPPDPSFTVKSHSLSFQKQLVYLFLTSLLSLFFYFEIPWFAILLEGEYYFQGQFLPRLFDSCCNGFSIIAQILCLLQYSDQWIWWIVVDLLQITMYCGIVGYGIVINIVLMWFLFLCNACYGFHSWRNRSLFSEEDHSLVEEGEKEEPEQKYYSFLPANDEQDEGMLEEEGIRYNILIEESEYPERCKPSNSEKKHSVHKTGDGIPFSFPPEDLSLDDRKLLKDPSYSVCRVPFAVGNMKHGFSSPLDPATQSALSQDSHMTLRPVRGVIIGKFWPFHSGHQYLCEQAFKHCDELYVILCHRPYHFPSKAVRLYWIQSSLPFAYCAAILDVYDPLDSELWALLTKAWCGFTPDVVFTSETYGEVWAKYLGCSHVLIDLNRLEVPVSGTMLRENLYVCLLCVADMEKKKEGKNYLQALDSCWKYLPPVVKHYFTKQVVIISEEPQFENERYSSSELCSELSTYFNSFTINDDFLDFQGIASRDKEKYFRCDSSDPTTTQQRMFSFHQREVNALSGIPTALKSRLLILNGPFSFHSFILTLMLNNTLLQCSNQVTNMFSQLCNHSTLLLFLLSKSRFEDYEKSLKALLKECAFPMERIQYHHIQGGKKVSPRKELMEECKVIIERFVL
jgi:cytidyltransferase-like protein